MLSYNPLGKHKVKFSGALVTDLGTCCNNVNVCCFEEEKENVYVSDWLWSDFESKAFKEFGNG